MGVSRFGGTLMSDTHKTIVDRLRQLVGTASVSSTDSHWDQGNRNVIDLLAGWLEHSGFAVEIQDVTADGAKANLIATRGSGPGGLVLSGHTHGGQIGLVSLGLDWTVLAMSKGRFPDHGLFGLGSSRLYVHRGTGFYGFPLRLGVPGEASLLELIR